MVETLPSKRQSPGHSFYRFKLLLDDTHITSDFRQGLYEQLTALDPRKTDVNIISDYLQRLAVQT